MTAALGKVEENNFIIKVREETEAFKKKIKEMKYK
jgi:hypothetical protein